MEWKEIAEKYAQFIALVIFFAAKEGLAKYKTWRKTKKLEDGKNDRLDLSSSLRRQIHEHLIKIQAYLGCNRVSIYEYSNGTYTMNGISLQFINMTYEVCDDATAPVINKFQLIPISPYLNRLSEIDANTAGYVRSSINDGTVVERRLRKIWSTHTSYTFKLAERVWEGCLSISNSHSEIELTDADIEYVHVEMIHIRDLMIKLKNKI